MDIGETIETPRVEPLVEPVPREEPVPEVIPEEELVPA